MYQNNNLYIFDIYTYIKSWGESPINLILGILDVLIVLFLLYKAIKLLRKTRAWQLLKGIAILVILTLISRINKIRNIKFYFNYNYDIWCNYFDCYFCAGAKKKLGTAWDKSI